MIMNMDKSPEEVTSEDELPDEIKVLTNDESKMEILNYLDYAKKEKTITEISKKTGLDRGIAYYHLKRLEKGNLIKFIKPATERRKLYVSITNLGKSLVKYAKLEKKGEK